MPTRLSLACSLLALAVVAAGGGCGFDWTVPEAGGAGGAGGLGAGGAGGSGGDPASGQTTTSSDTPGATTSTGGGGDPNDPGWGSDLCADCLYGAAQEGCGDLSVACQSDDGCQLLLECATQCAGDQACVEQCAANTTGESYQLYESLVSCAVCELCTEPCSGSPYNCG